MKKRTSVKQEPTVQIFSALTNMKFQPKSIKATEELTHKIQKKEKISSREVSQISNMGRRLTFVVEVMQHHFLIGNQNQLDFISVGGLINQFVDVEYFWSLNVPGPIQQVQLDPKKSLIVVYSLQKLHVFNFNSKKKHEHPKPILTHQTSDNLKFIRFPKDLVLGLFYDKHFEVYTFNEALTEMNRNASKKYGIKDNFVLLDVPPSGQNYLNLFFEQPKKVQAFGLWCLNITFDLIKIRVGTIFKIYDIMKKFKKVLEIKNYSKEIIFINLGSEVIAAKKGFIIDAANINIKTETSSLKYMSFSKLLHITNKRVQVYSFKVNTTNVPNRINLKPVDSLQLGDIPQNSVFIGASINKDSNITVFFQNYDANHTNGQIEYWFKTSYSIDRQSKVKKIFNYGKQISKVDTEILQSKYDIAEKMGLSQKQIYLEIWNRSSKSSVQDYNFLLATNHYKTIRTQIQNKLRKNTMSYRQLLKIEKSCYEVLQRRVYNLKEKCTEQDLQDFLTSHYYLKKLNLYMEISLIKKANDQKTSVIEVKLNPEGEQVMTIDIQQYSIYKEFQLKQFIVDQVYEFCFRGKQNMANEIRQTFKEFRFVIRTFYKQLLRDIIHAAKSNILKFLITIPQILPYKHILTKDQNPLMFQGVWDEISNDEWLQNLYLDNIITIENKQLVEQFIDSIWFKRSQRIYHILVPKKKQTIMEMNRVLNSNSIFFFFLSEVFTSYKQGGIYNDFSTISEIVNYVENHFDLFPQHLKSNVFLYYELYLYYASQEEWKQPKMSMEEFFTLKDYQLFRYFFDLQKIKKNCILKEIKPIYKKLHNHGNEIFNEGLLSYFDSEVSQLSDLKYLLNRINNQKAEFHEENLSMYEILLKAMQMKIKVGENGGATISQVLVYVQNIPTALLLSQQNQKFHQQLTIIKNIQKHQVTLQKMNLNMTIQYMLKRCQDVILKMVDFQIEDKKLNKLKQYDQFKQKSFQILEQIKIIKDNIYGDVYPNLSLFAFSTTILERQDHIDFLKKLFNEDKIKSLFTVDENFKENLVIYAYKLKFSQDSAFIHNENYCRKLFQFLPTDNNTRNFLESELKFGLIFSSPEQPLEYPISVNFVVPKAFQVEEIVAFLSKKHLQKINLEEVHSLLNKMHKISRNVHSNEKQFITLQKVYEIFIERFLKQTHSCQGCFSIFRKYLELRKKRKNTDDDYQCLDELSAYMSIFYVQIHNQLNEQSREKVTQLISLLYKEPETFLDIMEHLLKQKRTGLQTIAYLTKVLDEVRSRDLICFDPQNTLIQFRLTQQVKSENRKVPNAVLNKVIKNSLQNMKVQRQAFKVDQLYNIIFYTLCHSPLNCLTILRFYKEKIKYKQFRNYISFLTQEVVFCENELIQCFIIIFDVMLKNFKYNEQFQAILQDVYFRNKKGSKYQIFREVHNIEVFENPEEQYYKKLFKSLKRFLRKRASFGSMRKSRRKNLNRTQEIQTMFATESTIDTTKRSRAKRAQNPYPFSDSDFAFDDDINTTPPKILRRRRKFMRIDFDCQNQRLKMLKRSDQDLTEYLANTFELTLLPPPPGPIVNVNGNEDNLSQKSSIGDHAGLHKFKITERKKSVEVDKLKQVHEQEKNKYRVARQLGMDSVPTEYIMSHNIEVQRPGSAKSKSKIISEKFFEADNEQEQEDKFLKKQSYQSLDNLNLKVNKLSSRSSSNKQRELPTLPTIEDIKNQLLKSCHSSDINSVKIFDIKSLAKIKQDSFSEQDEKFSEYLKELLRSIYETQGFDDADKLNLLNQIVKKYSTLTKFCNKKILEIYLRFSTLKKSYEVDIDTTKIFDFDGILSDSIDVSDFYSRYHQKTLSMMNEDNAIKVSRLIALTFRKNSLEQEIIYAYFIKKLKEIGSQNKINVDQKQELLLRKIIFSMTIKRFVDNFEEILTVMKENTEKNEALGQIYRKIIQFILQSIQTKGDYRTEQQLKKKANLSVNNLKNSELQLKLSTSESNRQMIERQNTQAK